MGTRYILRAQDRIRRRREGLPENDDEDDHENYERTPRQQMTQLLGLDFGTSSLRLATASTIHHTRAKVIESAEGHRSIPAVVAVDNDVELVGTLAKALLGRKPGHTALGTRLLMGRSPEVQSKVNGCYVHSF